MGVAPPQSVALISHRMFDRAVDDQIVAAEWKPRPHGDKVSVLQRAGTLPFKTNTHTHIKIQDNGVCLVTTPC